MRLYLYNIVWVCMQDQGRYMVYASYLSICSDRVFDLLASPSRPTLLQTEESSDEAIGDGATEELVSSGTQCHNY